MFKLRPKTVFTKSQLDELENAFVSNPYLEKDRREILAFSLGLTDNQVSVWFQNRRARMKQKQPL